MKEKKKRSYGFIYAAAFALVCFFLSVFDIPESIDYFFSDMMFQKESDTCPDIKIVAIDEKTLTEFGPYKEANYRPYYAAAIKRISGYDPCVIALDIEFTGNSTPENDSLLVDACREAGNVITGAKVVHENVEEVENGKLTGIKRVAELTLPYSELADVCKIGLVNTKIGDRTLASEKSNDNYIRMTIPMIEVDGVEYDSLALAIYREYAKKTGSPEPRHFDSYEEVLFTYSSLPNEASSYTRVSLCDVVNGTQPLDDFEDAVVMIGAYATGLQDQFYTPINRSEAMFGVEVHANVFDALRKNAVQTRTNPFIYAALFALIVGVCAYVEFGLHIVTNSFITLGTCTLAVMAQRLLYSHGLYVPCIYIAIMFVILYISSIVRQYFFENLAKRRTLSAFKKYVAPQVVDSAMKDGEFEINLGGVKRNIACLFVDIRGFTPMSESLTPEQVVEVLNRYLSLVTEAIFKNEGTLDKFIGDAAMAIFNAPFDLPDYAYKAVMCALDIAKNSEAIEREFMEKFGRKVSYGIGVNIGDAVIGNIGSNFRMDYTAIGDTVNTAARLEANAKAGEILISERLYEVVKDRFVTECVGGLKLKGKANELVTYRVIGVKENNE